MSLWYSSEKFKLTSKPLRTIELFAGIGAQARALEKLGVEFEHYRICEFDQAAVTSYNAVHHTNFETSDITKIHAEDLGIVDTDKYNYLLTYSFPCTDLSVAGAGAGLAKSDWESGNSTRSGLLWEVERLLDECYANNGKDGLPQVLLLENVPQLLSEKRKNGKKSNYEEFLNWLNKLESLGYSNFYKVLNAAEYGYPEPIPQHRERVFVVSLLGDYTYSFPEKKPLTKRLKDMLEPVVDEKYYLSKPIESLLKSNDVTSNSYQIKETVDNNELDDGMYLNSYNRTATKDVAGTIAARVDASSLAGVVDTTK